MSKPSIFTAGGRLGYGAFATDPCIAAGQVVEVHASASINGEKPSAIDAAAAIEQIADRVSKGDMSDLEKILVAQAVSLSSMSAEMLMRSRKIGTRDAMDTLGAAGLRAAAAAREAINSLVNLRNPRQVTFAKQVNNSGGGPQQVNNGTAAASTSRTPAHEASPPTELLLEGNANPILEPRTKGRSGRSNQAMEAVEVVDRPKVSGRKSLGRA